MYKYYYKSGYLRVGEFYTSYAVSVNRVKFPCAYDKKNDYFNHASAYLFDHKNTYFITIVNTHFHSRKTRMKRKKKTI